MSQQTQNSMKKIFLSKVVLNIGVGKSGDAVEIAKKALNEISGKNPCPRNARATNRDWGIRKGEPIGAAVTIRGDDATSILKRLLEARDNQIKGTSFDDFGNVSFGIKEHINIPGIKYDPKIGIIGLEVAVSLSRPGFNVRIRSKHKASVGKSHIISRDDAKKFLIDEFGVKVI